MQTSFRPHNGSTANTAAPVQCAQRAPCCPLECDQTSDASQQPYRPHKAPSLRLIDLLPSRQPAKPARRRPTALSAVSPYPFNLSHLFPLGRPDLDLGIRRDDSCKRPGLTITGCMAVEPCLRNVSTSSRSPAAHAAPISVFGPLL